MMVVVSYILCFFLMLSSVSLANDPPQQVKLPSGDYMTILQPQDITVNMPPIKIEIINKSTSSTDTVTSSQSQSTAHVIAVNKTDLTTMTTMINKMKSIQEYAEQVPGHLQPWVIHNKWRIAAGCVAGLYVYTWYRLLYLSYALSDPDAWHNYKITLSFDELLRIKQEELAQDLIRAIQRRYAPQAIEDFFIPFTLFTKDIEKEITSLEQIIKVYKRLRMLRVNWLFPWQKPSLQVAQEKLRRVLYLQNVAFSWLGSFKLEKFTQLAPEYVFTR